MGDADFVRYFVSEYLIGTTQMQIKKMQQDKGQVPVDFNYMPADLQYAIAIKLNKEELDQAQHSKEEEAPPTDPGASARRNKEEDDLDAKFGPQMRI